MVSNISYAQIYQGIEEELTTESEEVNEEIILKLSSRISMNDFLTDRNIYSLFISESQHQKLTEHIENTGDLIDLLELQSTGIFTYKEYHQLQQIITIDIEYLNTSRSNAKIVLRGNYNSNKTEQYVGGQWGNYQQILLNISDYFKVGFSRENDFGENTNPLFPDHETFFIQKKWKRNELGIGEYQVFHGFGLLIGQGFSASFGNGGINNSIQHRWVPNANQTEFNTFRGSYYRKQVKNNGFTVGLSNQKIDLGSSSGLHRTTSEINKKDKEKEQVLIVGYEYNNRRFQYKTIAIKNIENSSIGISNCFQAYYRNMVLFSEHSYYNSKVAYSIGFMLLLSKDIPLSIAYTTYENEYTTPWMSNRNQGFTNNDGAGISFNIRFPVARKMNFEYSYRYNTVTDENEEFNKTNKYFHAIRTENYINRNIQITQASIIQYENSSSNLRSKLNFKISFNDKIKQQYQFYTSKNKSSISNAIAYNLVYRHKKIQGVYSIGLFNIQPRTAIYFQVDNILISKQNIGVYDTGRLQSGGFQYKLSKHINAGIFIQYVNNNNEKTNTTKLLYSLNFK